MLRKYGLLALLFLPLSAYGNDLSYSYVEVNYIIDREVKGGGAKDDGDGWNINGSYAFDEMFFITGSYSDTSLDNTNVDITNFNVGGGARFNVAPNVSAYGVISYEDYEVGVPGGGTVDDSGFGIAGGLRGMLMESLELNGQVKYVDIGDADGWSFKVGGLYRFNPNWAAGLDYSTGELDNGGKLDIDELRIGLRYIF